MAANMKDLERPWSIRFGKRYRSQVILHNTRKSRVDPTDQALAASRSKVKRTSNICFKTMLVITIGAVLLVLASSNSEWWQNYFADATKISSSFVVVALAIHICPWMLTKGYWHDVLSFPLFASHLL